MPLTTSTQDDISRQLDLVWRERYPRLSLTLLGLALTTIYLPIWIAAVCALFDLGSEILAMRWMRGLDPATDRRRYLGVVACVFAMEFAFALPAALIWQIEDVYAKAFAVGMLMTTLLHVVTARAIDLPSGLAGIAGVALCVVVGNTLYWVGLNDLWPGLALSTVGMVAGLGYSLTALVSNNRLHRDAALGHAAALAGDRAKSRFLAQMSHELRTPLNAILGMGHAELRRNRDTLSQKRLAVLIASAEGLSTILDDILDMSAIQQGRLPIRPEPVRPHAEILATLALFQPGIDEAGLVLRTDLAPDLQSPVMLDPQRLRQCLSNLLSNAIKHTTAGEIRVTAGLSLSPDAPSRLRIEVADTGSGIPPDLHDAVFEPFFKSPTQTTANRSDAPASNGLGLSISRAMARQMGGDLVLVAQSKDSPSPDSAHEIGGREIGTTIVLTLTVIPVPEATLAAHANPAGATLLEKPRSAARASAFGLRVLVVDDIATNRLVASTYLRMLGATMIEAASGDEALTLLHQTMPDLVLLDMNMPGMDGMETLTRIRALEGEVARVPVIAMTADAMEDHRQTYLNGGLDGYLTKPINPARIEAEITAVLGAGWHRPPG